LVRRLIEENLRIPAPFLMMQGWLVSGQEVDVKNRSATALLMLSLVTVPVAAHYAAKAFLHRASGQTDTAGKGVASQGESPGTKGTSGPARQPDECLSPEMFSDDGSWSQTAFRVNSIQGGIEVRGKVLTWKGQQNRGNTPHTLEVSVRRETRGVPVGTDGPHPVNFTVGKVEVADYSHRFKVPDGRYWVVSRVMDTDGGVLSEDKRPVTVK
jgi:hypothetical protein